MQNWCTLSINNFNKWYFESWCILFPVFEPWNGFMMLSHNLLEQSPLKQLDIDPLICANIQCCPCGRINNHCKYHCSNYFWMHLVIPPCTDPWKYCRKIIYDISTQVDSLFIERHGTKTHTRPSNLVSSLLVSKQSTWAHRQKLSQP